MNKNFKLYNLRKSMLLLFFGVIFSHSVFAETMVTQGSLVMKISSCYKEFTPNGDADGASTMAFCGIRFEDLNGGFLETLRGDIDISSANHQSFPSLNHTISRSMSSSDHVNKATFSINPTGIMNSLSYNDSYVYESLNSLEERTTKFPAGYYALRDSTGLYWTAYLEHLVDNENRQLLYWDAVDHPQHPWQACSAGDSFSRATGCGNGGGTVTPPPVTATGASIFDGAGSLISPAEDCYGCNKDSAIMQPHQGSSSTVVFQWRQISGCSTLAINASSSLPMTLSAKTWSSSAIKETYQATISENNLFSLNSLGEWTTFSITSKSPITHPIRIDAICANGFTGVSSQQLNPTAVKVDRGATWMGTGSIISDAQQGDANGYGVSQDVSIGSGVSNALTSFQWYASQSCSTLRIGDGVNASVTVSGKVWNEASFEQICTTLPCDISVDSANYYVLKLESSAGALPTNDNFPGGIVGAVCR